MATSTPMEEPRPFVAILAIPIQFKRHQIIETPEVFEPLSVCHMAIFARVGPGEANTKRHVYIASMGVLQRLLIPPAVAAARYVGRLISPGGEVHHVFLGEE